VFRGRRKSNDRLNGPRSKCWPPSYCDPPPLIVTDYGVCRASTPINDVATDDRQRPDSVDADSVDAEAPCERNSSVTITVTATDNDIADSQRLLPAVQQHVGTVPSTDGTVPLRDA